MRRLVDRALDAIGNDDPDVAADWIDLAGSFFEHSLGRTDVFHKEVLSEPASPADLARLRGRLIALVEAGAPDQLAGAAVFALGKLYDPSLIGFFVDVLRRYLRGDAGVLYQAMIALDNLDEDVFGRRTSMSIRNEDENRALAAEFVRRFDAGL